MAVEQLLLFPKTEIELLQEEVQRLREQCEKVRKGQYAKIGDTLKLCLETKHELEILKQSLCKNTVDGQFSMI